MTFAPFGRIDIEPVFTFLKILDVKKVFLLETGKFMYKKQKDLIPVSIGNYFKFRQNNSIYNLRSSKENSNSSILYRLGSSEKSIQFRGTKIWEGLPNEVKTCESLIFFKTRLKEFLINCES